MEEKLVKIINEMADYLNIAQMKKLQEVLIKNLSDARPEKEQISNQEYLKCLLKQNKLRDVQREHYSTIR